MTLENYDIIQKIVTKLKELPELFASLKSQIEGKLSADDIANNLTTETAGKVLDAYQGKVLKDALDKLAGLNHILSVQVVSVTIENIVSGSSKSGALTVNKPTGATGWFPVAQYAEGSTAGGTASVFTRATWISNTSGNTIDVNAAIKNDGASDATTATAAIVLVWLA